MKYYETDKIELKRTITKGIAKEVVAFLNTDGGTIYIGVDDDGSIVGVEDVDKTMREIRDIIRDQISPSTEGLCAISSIKEKDKLIVVINIKKGAKLYYIKKEGRSTSGCFYRDGTSSTSMSEEEIERRFKLMFEDYDFLKEAPAEYSPITLRQLKNFYDVFGFNTNDDKFAENLGLYTKEGKYNKIAELLADKNRLGFIYARFDGPTKAASFSETLDFGKVCILTAVEKLMNKLEGENTGITTMTSTRRHTKHLVDLDCLKEAVYNALAHNNWISGNMPAVYVYSNRIEIMSYGGLPIGQTKEGCLNGKSKPRSVCLMNILRDLEIVEKTGHGIPMIVRKYGMEAFKITDYYVLVTLPFDKDVLNKLNKNKKNINFNNGWSSGVTNVHLNVLPDIHGSEKANFKKKSREELVINYIKVNPYITFEEIAVELKLSTKTIKRTFASLVNKGVLLNIRKNQHDKWRLAKNKIKEIEDNNGWTSGVTNVHLNVLPDVHVTDEENTKNKYRESLIIKYIKNNQYVTYKEIAIQLNVSTKTVKRIFDTLKKKGILLSNRKNKYDKWIIVDDQTE